MTIKLSPELESIVNEKVQSGRYRSADDVIAQAVRLLDDEEARQSKAFRDAVQVGVDQLNRGEVHPFDPEEIKAEGRRILARKRQL